MAEGKGLALLLAALTIGGVALVKRAKAQPPNGNGSECDIDQHCYDLYGPGYICVNGVCVEESNPDPDPNPLGEVEVVGYSGPAEADQGEEITFSFTVVNNSAETVTISRVGACTKGWCTAHDAETYGLHPGVSRGFTLSLPMHYAGEQIIEIAFDDGDGIKLRYVAPILVI